MLSLLIALMQRHCFERFIKSWIDYWQISQCDDGASNIWGIPAGVQVKECHSIIIAKHIV